MSIHVSNYPYDCAPLNTLPVIKPNMEKDVAHKLRVFTEILSENILY